MHATGKVTASINWPVSLGSAGIDYNISGWFVGPGSTQDDNLYNRLLSTPGLAQRLERSLGPITLAARHDSASEEQDLRIAAKLIEETRPEFATVHFGSVDEAEHKFGPGSPEAKVALETVDGFVGRLIEAARKARPDTVVAIASDHGFTAVKTEVNLPRAFVDAGLIRLDEAGQVVSWDAAPWAAGGSAPVVLARPDDAELKSRVAALLDTLRADPRLGIAEVYDAGELARRGGFPGASFGISYRLDTTGPAARPITQALVVPARQKGTHGHSPAYPELRSSFFIAGPGIAAGHDLGIVDMRAIAPTLAAILGVALPRAEAEALNLRNNRNP